MSPYAVTVVFMAGLVCPVTLLVQCDSLSAGDSQRQKNNTYTVTVRVHLNKSY